MAWFRASPDAGRELDAGKAHPAGSRRDRNLEHAVPLVGEQLVSLLDLLEAEAVRHQPAKVEAFRLNDVCVVRSFGTDGVVN